MTLCFVYFATNRTDRKIISIKLSSVIAGENSGPFDCRKRQFIGVFCCSRIFLDLLSPKSSTLFEIPLEIYTKAETKDSFIDRRRILHLFF